MDQNEVPAPFQVVHVRPQMISKGKLNQRLLQTDLLKVGVQVVATGGETNMHAHPADEAVWLVLDGAATFYGQGEDGQGERVVAELNRHEMLLIPRGTPYWFESSGDTPLVILRFAAKDLSIGGKRVDFGERRAKPREVVAGTFFGQ